MEAMLSALTLLCLREYSWKWIPENISFFRLRLDELPHLFAKTEQAQLIC